MPSPPLSPQNLLKRLKQRPKPSEKATLQASIDEEIKVMEARLRRLQHGLWMLENDYPIEDTKLFIGH